jgi:hypothetical protein
MTEVLRLRAINSSACDSSAKRFAQDDGFAGRMLAPCKSGAAESRTPDFLWALLAHSEVHTHHTNQNQRKKAKGAPGLAFETWDPRNPYLMDTRDVTTGTQTR